MSEYSKEKLVSELQNAKDYFTERLRSLRSGRAKADMFNTIMVEAYGSNVTLQTVANVAIENALSVVISPYDKSIANEIVKAISQSELNLSPINEGERIRINIPSLTEETRKQTVKEMHQMHEDARITVRQIRQKYMDKVTKSEDYTEDDQSVFKKEIQAEIDKVNNELQEIADKKEEEIMTI